MGAIKAAPKINTKELNIPKRKILSMSVHSGWCYENILGSVYKCNPFFSGNYIEITVLLQMCNEIYDTSTIISGEVYKFLPSCIKEHCRLLDCGVVRKGAPEIHSLYSIDFFP